MGPVTRGEAAAHLSPIVGSPTFHSFLTLPWPDLTSGYSRRCVDWYFCLFVFLFLVFFSRICLFSLFLIPYSLFLPPLFIVFLMFSYCFFLFPLYICYFLAFIFYSVLFSCFLPIPLFSTPLHSFSLYPPLLITSHFSLVSLSPCPCICSFFPSCFSVSLLLFLF